VTDAQIFTAADAYLKASLVGVGLTDPGNFQIGSDTFLANPFVTVGYVPQTYEMFTLRRSIVTSAAAKTPYKADMWSLRKRFVLSSSGRYILIRRSHVRKRLNEWNNTKDCKVASFEVDNSHHALTSKGGYLTTYNHYSCDAIVVNRAGAGVCVTISGTTITIGPDHKNKYGTAVGYSTSDKFMWAHLLDERGLHTRFRQAAYPTAPVSGFRNFSEKCDTPGCTGTDIYQLYLPDKALLHP